MTERRVRMSHERMGYPMEEFEPSLTQVQYQEESDINNILKRYRETGYTAGNASSQPMFGDFSNIPSYHEALNTVLEARAAFDALPSDIRTKFNNDPQEFLDFVGDDANYEEAVKLGICQATPVPDVEDVLREPPKGE